MCMSLPRRVIKFLCLTILHDHLLGFRASEVKGKTWNSDDYMVKHEHEHVINYKVFVTRQIKYTCSRTKLESQVYIHSFNFNNYLYFYIFHIRCMQSWNYCKYCKTTNYNLAVWYVLHITKIAKAKALCTTCQQHKNHYQQMTSF